jgi:hypothetical protein
MNQTFEKSISLIGMPPWGLGFKLGHIAYTNVVYDDVYGVYVCCRHMVVGMSLDRS